YRRSIYHQNVRASRVDLISDFDSPDCALSEPRRVTTTSPLQALTLMNHQFTLDVAHALGERITERAAHEPETALSTLAFELMFSRRPTPFEIRACEELTDEHGLDALLRTLLNTNEFIYIN
ncbi:MAG: DUF1553 domain-containing protein, partial [Candidatus Hydrogenedentota bacterium]